MVVVTGAAGHVGGNLVRALLAEGRRVRVVVRDDTRAIEGLDVERVRGDVLDIGSLKAAFDGAEVVYHLAVIISITGDQGGRVRRTNVEGPRNVAAACLDRKVRRLVHFSSIHAYSPVPYDSPVDETRPFVEEGAPAYDRSKALGQGQILEAVAKGLDAVIVNPTAVIGPHDYKPSRMGAVQAMLYRRKMPALVAGGFDWVDVRDVVAGALAAEKRGRTGQNYLLSGRWATFAELAAMVHAASGVKVPSMVTPMWLAYVGAPFVQAFSRVTGSMPLYTIEALHALRCYHEVSHAKASAELGYAPRPLEQTVADTWQWWKERGLG
jgi:dihydroflavonol-4-reductase